MPLNGTLPFALALVPVEKAGLGMGLYFSSGALATSVFAALLKGDSVPIQIKTLLAALAFLLAGLCIGLTSRVKTPSSV